MLSKAWKCRSGTPCTAKMTSFIYKYIWVSISRVCDRPGPVFDILKMASYQVIRSNMLTMVLAMFIRISEKAQKNLGELNHPISSTRSMQIMMQSSSVSSRYQKTFYTRALVNTTKRIKKAPIFSAYSSINIWIIKLSHYTQHTLKNVVGYIY